MDQGVLESPFCKEASTVRCLNKVPIVQNNFIMLVKFVLISTFYEFEASVIELLDFSSRAWETCREKGFEVKMKKG